MVSHLAGWDILAVGDNERILSTLGDDKIIWAKISLVKDNAEKQDLYKKFKVCAGNSGIIVSENRNTFIFNHLRWYVDSYVTSGEKKYRSYYYACLGECYIVVELVTCNPQSVLMFVSEAKRLIRAIDYSSLNRNNRFVVNGFVYRICVPVTYSFSQDSTDSRLVFLGETGYAIVNVAVGKEPLSQLVDSYASLCNICVMDCEVSKAGDGTDARGEWVSYYIKYDNKIICTCTYLRKFFCKDAIALFLYEKGISSLRTYELFDFEREVEPDA